MAMQRMQNPAECAHFVGQTALARGHAGVGGADRERAVLRGR